MKSLPSDWQMTALLPEPKLLHCVYVSVMFFFFLFSGDQNDPVKSSGAMPLNLQPVPATTNHTPMEMNPASKPELLPANLVDLTVREMIPVLERF